MPRCRGIHFLDVEATSPLTSPLVHILAAIGPPHEDVLRALASITILLIAARAMGELAIRLRQPAVVGEILAGILLGPSLLSGLAPALGEWIVPQTTRSADLVGFVGLLGAVLLLLITGLETDVPLIRRHLRTASWIAAGGLVLPFLGGLAVSVLVPDSALGDPARRGVFALFLATALAVSAIPVVAKILLDLGLIRSRFGQTVLAAGMIDDTVAWILLSVVIALASSTTNSIVDVVVAALPILVFIGLALTLGRWGLDRVLAVVQDRGRSPDRVFTVVVASALVLGTIAQALGIEAVLGAFVVGVVFSQSPRLPVDVVHRLHTVTLAVLSPVFFALAGLQVTVDRVFTPALAGLTLVISLVAIVTKIGGASIGARIAGVDWWTASGYGSALNARGAVGIIIASLGLGLGVFSEEVYSIIVLVAVLTSLIAATMVRGALSRAPASGVDESEVDGSGFRRLLVPVRPREAVTTGHRTVAQIVDAIADQPSVTLLAVTDRPGRQAAERFLNDVAMLSPVRPTRRIAVGDPADVILDALGADHDLLVLGAPEATDDGHLFDPLVDSLARLATCHTLIVAGSAVELGSGPRRVLVPVNGSAESAQALRLAVRLAAGGEVVVMNVVELGRHARVGAPEPAIGSRLALADDMVRAMAADASKGNDGVVAITPEVRSSRLDVATTVLERAHRPDIDMIVAGTSLRPGGQRLHLGPNIEAMLAEAKRPVVLLNCP